MPSKTRKTQHPTVESIDSLLRENSSLRLQIDRLQTQHTDPSGLAQQITATLNIIREGVFLLDEEWRFIYVNQKAEELWGKKGECLLGKVIWDEFPMTESKQPFEELRRAAVEQAPIVFETNSPVSHEWLEVEGYPKNHRMLVVHHVITKQKELELALRQKEKRYRELFENAPIGIYRTTPNGHILMVNPALLTMLGYESFEELARLNLENEGYPTSYTRQEFKNRIEREGEVMGAEASWMKRDGSIVYVRENAKVIRDSDGSSLFYEGTVEDISERKRFEDELQRLNRELESRVEDRTSELRRTIEELETFSYSVSHDLRSPLRAINNFASIVLADNDQGLLPESKRQLQIVIDSAKTLGRLVDDLLDFTRIGRKELQFSRVNMTALVHETVHALRQMEPADRAIKISIHTLPEVRGNAPLLHITWMNLLSNAIKFTRNAPDVKITVGCSRTHGDPAFFVSDNGPGFDQEYAHKVFEVFERLHVSKEYEGTGIGLALVKRIIERHGGRVWAEAKPKHGATFYFTLPGSDMDRGVNQS